MKILIICGFVLGIVLNGQCNEPNLKKLLTSPGKSKMQQYVDRSSSLKFLELNSPARFKNSHEAQFVTAWEKRDQNWEISHKEVLTYYPDTYLVKEKEFQYYSGSDEYSTFTKSVIQYDEKERPVIMETYFSDDFEKEWRLVQKEVQAFDKRDDIVLSEYYYENSETGTMELVWGFKAEDAYNENGTITERIWYQYGYFGWVPGHKETYTLNENDIVTEIVYTTFNDLSQTWEPESKNVFTLNEKGEWEEALIYMTAYDYEKPIYLLGNGTQAGWNNQQGLEMLYIGDGKYGVMATLRETGDQIKFISILGQWAPQWGYGGDGDATSGTLTYRPSEAFPDPLAISIATLEVGEYIVYADTLLLTYEIFPYDNDDKNDYPWLEKKTKEDEWFLVHKITDVKWFDFSKLKPEQMTAYINMGSLSENKKSLAKNDIEWKEYERGFWTYHETGLPISEEFQTWLANQWMPESKTEWAYDHFLNNISFENSSYNGGTWNIEDGYILAMSYNTNGSILSYQFVSYYWWEKGYNSVFIWIYNYENLHSMAVILNPFDAATTNGHGTYAAGANVTLTANVNPGYSFLNWADVEGNIHHEESSFETTMPDGNMLVVANFATIVNTHEVLAANFKLFPNPARDQITITATHPILRIMICDITGKIVYDHEGIYSTDYRMAIPELKPGIYLARVVTDKEIHTCKMQVVSK